VIPETVAIIAAVPAALYAIGRAAERLIDRAYPTAGRLVQVDGIPLHLIDRGPRDAPAVVLIHGASGNHRDLFIPLGHALEKRYRVIAVDRPGHGGSGRVPTKDAAAPDHQAAVIAKALTMIGVRRAVVFGHSFGAATAAAFAADHPDRTSGLVLLTPATHPWGGSGISWHNRFVAVSPLGRAFAALFPIPIGSAIMRPALQSVFKPDAVPHGYARKIGAWLVLRAASFRANAEDVSSAEGNFTRTAPRYRGIVAPTTVIVGEHDSIVWNHVHAVGLQRDVPHARLMTLPAGHMPHWTATADVLRQIEELMDAPDQAAATSGGSRPTAINASR
jgi:pimeloyl-ACP methyl ester carboxylesterase